MRFGKLMVAVVFVLSATQPSSYAAEKIQPTANSITRTPPRQNPDSPVTQPEYPIGLADAGVQGEIILDFYVRPDGSVDAASIKVEKSTGVQALDDSAVSEAARWTFLPATENGQPVGSDHKFRVVFDLMKARSEGSAVQMDAEDFPGTLEAAPGQTFVPMNMEDRDTPPRR